MSVDAYVIEPRVLASVRLHAGRAPSGDWETGGRLLLERDRLVAYQPLENVSAAAGYFECAPGQWPRPPWLLVHSHPGSRYHTVSEGDVEVMKSYGMERLAVFTPLRNELSVWVLDPSCESGVREVPVVERRSGSSWRPPPRRPGRRR